jgi:hypothetical protein
MGLSKDEANRILVEEGWFHGHAKILREHDVSNEQAAQLKVGLFKLILEKVLEAKSEIARLQVVIGRMEATCRAGIVPKPAEAQNAHSPDVMKLRDEMRAFDGWVISLLESDISLLAAVENPETAGGRVKSLQQSFADLWNLRIKGFKMMARHPEVFNVLTFVK